MITTTKALPLLGSYRKKNVCLGNDCIRSLLEKEIIQNDICVV